MTSAINSHIASTIDGLTWLWGLVLEGSCRSARTIDAAEPVGEAAPGLTRIAPGSCHRVSGENRLHQSQKPSQTPSEPWGSADQEDDRCW